MRAGKLRDRVQIQRKTITRDSVGQALESWETIFDIRADIEPVSGREFLSANAEQQEVTTKIWIRYRAGISPEMRLVHGSRIYDIKAVLESAKRSRICLMCISRE